MERSRVQSLVMVYLVLGLLVGQSSANFKECYNACFLDCTIKLHRSIFRCAGRCIRRCFFQNSSETQYFCKLGCATDLCTYMSTKDKPAGEKEEDCVGSCSKTCTKN